MAEIPIQRKEGRNIWPMIIGLLALAALLWWMLSRRNDADTVAGRADTTAVASSGALATDSAGGAMAGGAAGTAGGMANSAGTAGTTGSMTDADVAVAIHEVNAGEIAAGEIAQTKASNADVKAYARDMVRAHKALDAKAAKLATGTASSAIRDSVVKANETMGSQLQSAGSGAAFDKAYIDGQVMGHQNTLALLQRAQGQAQSSDLQQIITTAIPDVEKHLARARTIQSKLGQ